VSATQYDTDALRIEVGLKGVGNLCRDPFLDRDPACEHVNQAQQFRQSYDFAIG
jgi:hypothetical protein